MSFEDLLGEDKRGTVDQDDLNAGRIKITRAHYRKFSTARSHGRKRLRQRQAGYEAAFQESGKAINEKVRLYAQVGQAPITFALLRNHHPNVASL
jgi:hypothetical protein